MAEFGSWEDLVKALRSGDNDIETWTTAEKAINELAKPEHVPDLYELLAESDYIFPGELVAVHLARLEGVNALPALVKRFSEAPNPQNADGLQNVIYRLVITHPDEVLPYLLSLVDSPDARLRENAAGTLGTLYPRVDAKIFETLLRDDDAGVRATAIGAVARFKGQEWALDTLIKALDDQESIVQIAALVSLREFNDKRAISFVSKYLNDAKLWRFARESLMSLQKSGEN